MQQRVLVFSAIIGLSFLVFTMPAPANAAVDCDCAVSVGMKLTAHFITLPDVSPLSAEGEGDVCAELGEKSAAIAGESMPQLVFQAEHPPAGLDALTVIVEGMPGTRALISWDHLPEVVLEDVDMRVRAYDEPFQMISDGDRPVVDIVLSDLTFSTAKIDVEGVEAEGFIDAERRRVLLVGKVTLPEYDFGPYDEWLSGQPVLLELTVKMKNLYKKT